MSNRKIKICHVVSADITLRFILLSQLKYFIASGYEVHAVCSPGKWVEFIRSEGIQVKTIAIKRKMSPFSDLVAFIKLWRYFLQQRFDVVHTHGLKSGLLGQWAAKLAGVAIIFNTIHGLYATERSSWLKKKMVMAVEKAAAFCSDLILSQNQEDIATLVREKVVSPEKIVYRGNGINIGRFDIQKFPPEVVSQKKKALGLPPAVKIIGTVGRLVKEKGYVELFQALSLVLKKYPDTILLAVGPDEPEKKDGFDVSLAETYGVGANVVFLGERSDMEELYPVMDVFVLASHREGFPRSVIEAMAMERPIVVTDIRGCREEIDHDKNGLMVPVKNPEKLAEAILFFLENPEKAKEMAKNAKIKALHEFDENLVFSRIALVYSTLINKSKEKLG